MSEELVRVFSTAAGTIAVAILGVLVTYASRYIQGMLKRELTETEREVQRQLTNLAETAVTGTMQTFVDEAKKAAVDGKLTREQAGQAFRMTKDKMAVLLRDGSLDVADDVVDMFVEAAVRTIKNRKW